MQNRVLSGMRPTGKLHLGHYHGVLKNWCEIQNEYDSFFFVANWHSFTTHYADKIPLEQNTIDMVIDWLAAGINPNTATIFTQSSIKEHAELHLLLSMITPLSWLKRVPSYKDQQEKLAEKDLKTYGFLGYPLLQSADILMYKAQKVPVGLDQVAHVELTREIARRFNHIYGKEEDFAEKAIKAIDKMGKSNKKRYLSFRKLFQEQGDKEALVKAQLLLKEQQNITLGDRERLLGYLEGGGLIILPEPEALLTDVPKMPGTDGQKMSKSYNNTISLRDSKEEISNKIKRMPTDPARIKITDPGNVKKCHVWQWHKIYSKDSLVEIKDNCENAKIGCIDCKQPLINKICKFLEPIQERATEYQDVNLIKQILHDGTEKASFIARETMQEVRQVMGLGVF